jgi:transcriptional antiterminator RfaH
MPIIEAEVSIFPPDLLSHKPTESPPADRQWWVMHTRSRQEKCLARELLSRGIAFYLPLVAKRLAIRGTVVRSYLPLFASYVFVFCTPDERLAAVTSKRVASVLDVEDQVQLKASLHEVSRLIAAGAPLTTEARVQPNQRVRVKAGPLQGLEGIVDRRRNETRLVVWIKMLQQGVSVEVDDCFVEPVA